MRAIKTEVFSSVQDIPVTQWNSLLCDHSNTYSHAFWEAIEKSKLNDFSYRYVLFYDEAGAPAGLTSFYSITTDIAIFAPAPLRRLLAHIRKVFPRFLKVSMLECGTPITVNSPPFVTRTDIAPAEILGALHELLLLTAKLEKHFLIVIRDFEPNADALQPEFKKRGYHWVNSLPNTYMEIRWPTPAAYFAAMKSYFRSKLQRHLRKNAALKVRHELVDNFHDLADTLCAQWMVVHEQADEFQREVLTPEFYRQFSRTMGAHSKALLFYQEDRLVGHALILMDGELMRWLYFGRKDAVNDSLYIYVAHKIIETAILLDAKRLEMGLTTYSIKQDLGAQMTPIRLALRARNGFINLFVGIFYPLLNSTPNIKNKDVFKQDAAVMARVAEQL